MVIKAIYFFVDLCYNFYGDNMDSKNIESTIDKLLEQVEVIWRLL